MKRLHLPVIVFWALLLFGSCTEEEVSDEPRLTDFQEETIGYFKVIALGVEFGNFSEVTRKWKSPMVVYAGGTPSPEHVKELEEVASEINTLVTDGFNIRLTQDSSESNFYIHFGSREDYISYYPEISNLARNEMGLSYAYFNQRAELFAGHMFVDITRAEPVEQLHLIREELTQAIGLSRHASTHPNSIFDVSNETLTSYAEIDRELIRLLYHPNMVAGVTDPGCTAILQNIYISENSD
ncbi:MAG: DUF2927 domain-containing protein [Cyclobacteriaceae bacterium]